MMIDAIALAGAVFAGTLAALEGHSILRRLRSPGKPVRVPKPAPWTEPPATQSPKDAPAAQQRRLEQLARDLLDPDAYGWSVSQEVRNAARTALGRPLPKPTQ